VMLTQFRQLAALWHGRMSPLDIPELCHFGDEGSLRRMKISCAADMVENKSRQIFPSSPVCLSKAEDCRKAHL